MWFIDANILAHWVLGRGYVLELLIDKFNLSKELSEMYITRYKSSIDFIDEVIEQKTIRLGDEFYVSHLAVNELFSALRDELRSLLLFNEGFPISRWRDPRINLNIKPEHYELIYEQTLKSFDYLFGYSIKYLEDRLPEENKQREYWSIYSSILFLIKNTRTQDATLLTTAIINEADYFVTKDEPLIKSAKERIKKGNYIRVRPNKN